MRIATLLDQIDSSSLLLPEFQRGFVWTRDKIRRFVRSLYRGYPVGGILLWESDVSKVPLRGQRDQRSGLGSLVLDGQQRLTTLYSLTRGKPPTFFDGDPDLFRGLHFHLEDERFQFFATSQDTLGSLWVDAGRLLREGIGGALDQVQRQHPKNAATYLQRLNRLTQVVERTLSVDLITGSAFDLDAVVDIFNQVNSGGTILSKGDLALARLCATTSDARRLLRTQVDRLAANGCPVGNDLLLRCVTAVATGRASMVTLDSLTPDAFKYALTRTPEYLRSFLRTASEQVGLDLESGLPGRGALPVVARWYDSMPGTTPRPTDGLLYWYLRCVLQDHYGRSIETVLNRDLAILDRDGLAGLLREMDREVGGSFQVEPHDLDGSTAGSRSYKLIHMLGKIRSRDSAPNDARRNAGENELKPCHIFPKKWLRDLGWPAKHVNSNANICFLPEPISAQLDNRTPNNPLAGLGKLSTATLATHSIPSDRKLWQPHAYLEFLDARQTLLAAAMQDFLESLRPRQANLRLAGSSGS